MRHVYLAIILTLLPGIAAASGLDFFSPQTRLALPEAIRTFVNRYLSERIDGSEADNVRRMEFDEVEVTFPLTETMAQTLAAANGLSMSLHDGKRYSIVWTADSVAIGAMSFPASYSLIHATTQTESFKTLANKLNSRAERPGSNVRAVATNIDSALMRRRPGEEFILGHLTSNTYIDAATTLPVWSKNLAAESLANLFIVDDMPQVGIDLTMVNYNLDSLLIATNSSSLTYLLGAAEGCAPYFGIAAEHADRRELRAVVVYHNPLYAYIHLLELTASTDELFADKPRIKASLRPYVKLHNLTELWGKQIYAPSHPIYRNRTFDIGTDASGSER